VENGTKKCQGRSTNVLERKLFNWPVFTVLAAKCLRTFSIFASIFICLALNSKAENAGVAKYLSYFLANFVNSWASHAPFLESRPQAKNQTENSREKRER